MKIPSPVLLLSQLAAIALASITADAQAQLLPSAVVAYTGQIAPGTGGATYFLLYQPGITSAGDITFRSEITGAGVNGTNNRGLWRQNGGGPIGLFLRAGGPTPIPGTTWSTNVGEPTTQTVGGATRAGLFFGLLAGATAKDAIWSEQPGGMRAVAVQGDPVPGIPGATFQPGLSIFDTKFDEDGELLFSATVTGGGTTPANNAGLWLDDGSTTTLVVRSGDDAIGFPPGTVFSDFSTYSRLSPGGLVNFWSNPFVPGLGMNQTGIWTNRSGTLAPVLLQGDSAPGLGPGETIGPGAPYANRAGQIAFLGTIYGGGGGTGLWISDTGGNPALVYRTPASNSPFSLNGTKFFLADNGIFYEITNTFASGTAHQAIVAIGPSGWREVAHVGERAAGLNAGIVYSFIDQYLVNANGQVAFRATITGPGVYRSEQQDPGGAGQRSEVPPGRADRRVTRGLPRGLPDDLQLAPNPDYRWRPGRPPRLRGQRRPDLVRRHRRHLLGDPGDQPRRAATGSAGRPRGRSGHPELVQRRSARRGQADLRPSLLREQPDHGDRAAPARASGGRRPGPALLPAIAGRRRRESRDSRRRDSARRAQRQYAVAAPRRVDPRRP